MRGLDIIAGVLPEAEKAYDRETVRTVVRVLREQGYDIVLTADREIYI